MPILDVHGLVVTPGAGATYTLGVGTPTIPAGGDGASVAGTPIGPNARLVMWGFNSVLADTLARVKLASQDMIDPLNGEDCFFMVVATGINSSMSKFTNVPYKTGQRLMRASTNTGVTAGTGALVDFYPDGQAIKGSRVIEKQVMPPGPVANAAFPMGALTTNQWASIPFNPNIALPNGKYAILGARAMAMISAAWIRFRHSDFAGKAPGFPLTDITATDIITDQITSREPIMRSTDYQFVYLSEMLNQPCCPVFSIGNAGTGLQIDMISPVADSPCVQINIAKLD